jgi:hypothetical protein
MEIKLHEFLILTLDKGEWLASQPGHLALGEERPLLISQKDGWTPHWPGCTGEKKSRHRRQGPKLNSLFLQPERLHYHANNFFKLSK